MNGSDFRSAMVAASVAHARLQFAAHLKATRAKAASDDSSAPRSPCVILNSLVGLEKRGLFTSGRDRPSGSKRRRKMRNKERERGKDKEKVETK